jgi:hypothetical protein
VEAHPAAMFHGTIHGLLGPCSTEKAQKKHGKKHGENHSGEDFRKENHSKKHSMMAPLVIERFGN